MTLKVLHRLSTETPSVGQPGFERIVKDPGESFLWRLDDYPFALGRWNYHPEFEIHLVRKSSGRSFVGDHIGQFGPGSLSVVGSNLPHNWVTAIKPGEVIEGRDIVIQFSPDMLRRARDAFPELTEVEEFLAAASRGLSYHGETARQAAGLMEAMGAVRGLKRLVMFLDLIRRLAVSNERTVLASEHYAPNPQPDSPPIIQSALDYILDRLQDSVSMSEAARIAGMTRPTFCRTFRKNTGRTFGDYVRTLRVGRSCRLLAETDERITDICFLVGYRNISNFNRHFRMEKGVTPTEYRRLTRARM